VLRGGSFNNNQQNARCAYRNNNHPNNWNNNIGFRVVVHSLPAIGFPIAASILRWLRLAQRGRRPVQPIPGRA